MSDVTEKLKGTLPVSRGSAKEEARSARAKQERAEDAEEPERTEHPVGRARSVNDDAGLFGAAHDLPLRGGGPGSRCQSL